MGMALRTENLYRGPSAGSQGPEENKHLSSQYVSEEDKRATTNVQHRFVLFFFFSFLLLELKPFVLKGKALGDTF